MTHDGKRQRSKEKGYTLIEVLISLTIFSVGMLAVASMQIMGINGNKTAKFHTNASNWSGDRIERLMALDYDDTNLASGSAVEGSYNIAWTVTDNQLLNNVKTIAVTVSWKDRDTDKSTTFNYYKADL